MSSFKFALFLLAFIVLAGHPSVTAQNSTSGILFRNGMWHSVLEKAKEQNKLIFVDLYTTWCPPCKAMEKEIFPLKSVVNKYNRSFINLKIDAESPEGKILMKKYELMEEYPTFIFVQSNGDLLYKSIGYQDSSQFMSLADTVLYQKKNEEVLETMRKRYSEGCRDKLFLEDYCEELLNHNLSASKEIDAYVSTLSGPNEINDSNALMILKGATNAGSGAFLFILNHQKKFEDHAFADPNKDKKYFGNSTKEKLINILNGTIIGSLVSSIQKKDSVLFRKVIRRAYHINGEDADFYENINMFKITFYAVTHDTMMVIKQANIIANKYMNLTQKDLDKRNKMEFKKIMRPYKEGVHDSTKIRDFLTLKKSWKKLASNRISNRLIYISRQFYLLVNDLRELKKALEWSRRAIELDDTKPKYLEIQKEILSKIKRLENQVKSS